MVDIYMAWTSQVLPLVIEECCDHDCAEAEAELVSQKYPCRIPEVYPILFVFLNLLEGVIMLFESILVQQLIVTTHLASFCRQLSQFFFSPALSESA